MHEPARPPLTALWAAIERSRKRLWGLCYRMTGSRSDADELSQEAVARAIERMGQLTHEGNLEGWLLRIATTVCLDHLRRRQTERRATELADPVEIDVPGTARGGDPEGAVLLRDDVRLAVVVALQRLPGRQRAALILHDVLDRSLAEVAETLDTNPNAANALVQRARATLARERVHTDVDPVVDRVIVERVVRAITGGAIEDFTALMAEDVWLVTDGGGVARAASKPVFGLRAVSRFFAAVARHQTVPTTCEIRVLNGEPAIVLSGRERDGEYSVTVHLETRAGQIAAVRLIRDPRRLAHLHLAPRAAGAAAVAEGTR